MCSFPMWCSLHVQASRRGSLGVVLDLYRWSLIIYYHFGHEKRQHFCCHWGPNLCYVGYISVPQWMSWWVSLHVETLPACLPILLWQVMCNCKDNVQVRRPTFAPSMICALFIAIVKLSLTSSCCILLCGWEELGVLSVACFCLYIILGMGFRQQ